MGWLGLLMVMPPAEVPVWIGVTVVLVAAVERGLAVAERLRGR